VKKIADIYSPNKRSRIMSGIRRDETEPEILVRKFLFSQGFRYRKNDKRYPGTPDIVLPKYRTIIFVHGCFWHGHENCKAAALPKTRTEFWKEKIDGNIKRDSRDTEKLKSQGWTVITIWQCEMKNKESREERLEHLVEEIKGNY